ncbi:MAG: 3-isopropylmalate dehydratase [Candidatus Aminicenantes bacterium]
MKAKGRIWVLTDSRGRLIEDIDTDQIFHNAFLHITDMEEMGRHALGNLEGWKDFSSRTRPGDILVAGRNFGAGSSRQQAVDCFSALKIALIIAPSFGAIYFRNAVNSALPLLRGEGVVEERVENGQWRNGDVMDIDLASGAGVNLTREEEFQLEPTSRVQRDILEAGGLFAYARKIMK